jgi:hypothetical protein
MCARGAYQRNTHFSVRVCMQVDVDFERKKADDTNFVSKTVRPPPAPPLVVLALSMQTLYDKKDRSNEVIPRFNNRPLSPVLLFIPFFLASLTHGPTGSCAERYHPRGGAHRRPDDKGRSVQLHVIPQVGQLAPAGSRGQAGKAAEQCMV